MCDGENVQPAGICLVLQAFREHDDLVRERAGVGASGLLELRSRRDPGLGDLEAERLGQRRLGWGRRGVAFRPQLNHDLRRRAYAAAADLEVDRRGRALEHRRRLREHRPRQRRDLRCRRLR